MNKKQREAKRKNAQAHQKKVKELDVLWSQNRVDRKQLITRELFKADRVIAEVPKPLAEPVSDVFEEFFARHLEQGSGIPMTPELDRLIRSTNPFPIIGRKCN